MLPRESHPAAPSAFGTTLYRIAVTTSLQATVVLVACLTMGRLSGGGIGPYLQAVGLCFSVVGAFALGRGLGAERRSAPEEAGSLYAAALVNYSIAYIVSLAHRFTEMLGAPTGPL